MEKINVFISFDIEGVGVVSSWRELRDSTDLTRIRRIATEEVNAVIRGIRNSRVPIGKITICDSHGLGENLLIEQLEPGIHLTKGSPRMYYMIEGIEQGYDLLFLIGYHAMAGTTGSGMDHTYSSRVIYNVKINGRNVGEAEINTGVAGHYGVALAMVSGDDLLIKAVKKFFGTQVETVITKYGVSRFAARCRHPLDVQKELEMKSKRAVEQYKRRRPFRIKTPIYAEVEVLNSLIGDLVELIPDIKRISARRFKFKSPDILRFYRILRLICVLGGYADRLLT
ncbi:hypothetical protein BXT86_05215 [candidate division WOR-3 bacterium 4484_100]|uniref:Peptidase M55 n=1 Tax=candidate division WOR-3 bacterium 4484_100 TaxID=1936077 RepID=A0A1V4QE71_UNCW3|nr:MAG: hypothetical protein BXT86_05215 [candidate division WOR-3 bacterium 4484_100]